MKQILEEISDDVDESIEHALNVTGKGARAKLKEVSPKEHGDYAKGWKVKRTDDKEITIYNSKMPGLAHLLNNGHAIVNKYGECGRYNGDHHIDKVEEEYIEKYEQAIIEAINNKL